MADKDLTIHLKLDKAAAEKAAAEFADHEKQRHQQVLTDAQATERAKAEQVRKANAERVAAARAGMKTEGEIQAAGEKAKREAEAESARLRKQLDKQTAQSAKDAAKAEAQAARDAAAAKKQAARDAAATAKEAIQAEKTARRQAHDAAAEGDRALREGSVKTFAAIAASWRVVTQLAEAYGSAVTAAMAKQAEMTKQMVGNRDSLAELAALMGEKPENAFTIKMAKYNKETWFKPEEGRSFLTELYNSGTRYKGKNISNKEFDQYAEQSGQLALALGIKPDVVGDVAGGVLGFTDYNKFGENASEEALGHVHAALKILGRGKGDNAVLARQYSMLSSASVNEDEMQGAFTTPEEAAAALSIGAEKHDAQSAELVRMAQRGLRGFGDKKKQAPLLKEAGIDAHDTFQGALEKLTPVIQAHAKAQGLKTENVLRENFEDEGTSDALSVFINKGVIGGGFKDRAEFGKTVSGQEPARALIKEYQTSERGMQRAADADAKLAEDERGAELSKLEIVRKQALAEMIRNKEIDVTGTNLADYAEGKISFGALGDERQRRIDFKAAELVKRRLPQAAKTSELKWAAATAVSPEGIQAYLQQGIRAIERAGGNPFGEGPPPRAAASKPPAPPAPPPTAGFRSVPPDDRAVPPRAVRGGFGAPGVMMEGTPRGGGSGGPQTVSDPGVHAELARQTNVLQQIAGLLGMQGRGAGSGPRGMVQPAAPLPDSRPQRRQ